MAFNNLPKPGAAHKSARAGQSLWEWAIVCKRVTKVFLFSFYYSLHCTACGILFSQPGIEPAPLALETWGLIHWTAREVPFMRHSEMH